MIQVNCYLSLGSVKSSSISPEFVSIALGTIAVLLMLGLLWWVDKRVKVSEETLADAQAVLVVLRRAQTRG